MFYVALKPDRWHVFEKAFLMALMGGNKMSAYRIDRDPPRRVTVGPVEAGESGVGHPVLPAYPPSKQDAARNPKRP
jgi:hypothetical protein